MRVNRSMVTEYLSHMAQAVDLCNVALEFSNGDGGTGCGFVSVIAVSCAASQGYPSTNMCPPASVNPCLDKVSFGCVLYRYERPQTQTYQRRTASSTWHVAAQELQNATTQDLLNRAQRDATDEGKNCRV